MAKPNPKSTSPRTHSARADHRSGRGQTPSQDAAEKVRELVARAFTTARSLVLHRRTFPRDNANIRFGDYLAQGIVEIQEAEEAFEAYRPFFERLNCGPVGIRIGGRELRSAHDACLQAAKVITSYTANGEPRTTMGPYTDQQIATLVRCLEVEGDLAQERLLGEASSRTVIKVIRKPGRPKDPKKAQAIRVVHEERARLPRPSWEEIQGAVKLKAKAQYTISTLQKLGRSPVG